MTQTAGIREIMLKIYYIDEITDYNGYKNIIYNQEYPVVYWFKPATTALYIYNIKTKQNGI